MTMAYGIVISGARWLAPNYIEGRSEDGIEPFKWTRSVADAEKFDTFEEAKNYAEMSLNHHEWTIMPIFGWFPDNNAPDGGSAIQMRIAA